MRSLLELAEPPSAVFVASDAVALGALRAARSAGVHVPGDLALGGFDDLQLAEYIVPPLTTVRVPWREIGATMARMLLGIVRTGQYPAPVLLETELIVRESCGAHGKGGPA
jgi:LacI family transcriptional regulator